MTVPKNYVDADELIAKIKMIYITLPYNLGYYGGDLAFITELNNKINQNIQSTLENFKTQLVLAIAESSKPYTDCKLCSTMSKPHGFELK